MFLHRTHDADEEQVPKKGPTRKQERGCAGECGDRRGSNGFRLNEGRFRLGY